MRARLETNAPLRIRRGGAADARFIRVVAEQVFSEFGDYGRILPSWLLHDGVLTHIAEIDDEPAGYTMLGFYAQSAELDDDVPMREGPAVKREGPTLRADGASVASASVASASAQKRDGLFVADLLAIAVAPWAQGRGVGKRLLEHLLEQVDLAQRRLPIAEVHLSVAETNARARGLFGRFGFERLDGDNGCYDGGQRALHMTRRV